MTGILYVDSSALVKLVVEEVETPALVELLAAWPLRVTSVVAAVEVPRAARRGSPLPAVAARAADVMSRLTLLDLDRDLIHTATLIEPAGLRTLDAIHLASALSLGPQLEGFLAYDRRLLDAAGAAALPVIPPASSGVS